MTLAVFALIRLVPHWSTAPAGIRLKPATSPSCTRQVKAGGAPPGVQAPSGCEHAQMRPEPCSNQENDYSALSASVAGCASPDVPAEMHRDARSTDVASCIRPVPHDSALSVPGVVLTLRPGRTVTSNGAAPPTPPPGLTVGHVSCSLTG
jgi:hypothetical protein